VTGGRRKDNVGKVESGAEIDVLLIIWVINRGERFGK